jgi:2,3-bisphosphoglycerate-dependent phosphoglycerate mutase
MTTDIIAEVLQLEMEEDPDLMERKFGTAEGKSYDEVSALAKEAPHRSPYTPVFDSGESDWDLFLRASMAIQNLLRREPGRYLLVSHGGLLNAAMHSILGIPPSPSGYRSILRLDNTGYATAEYNRSSDHWIILQVNDTRHLANSRHRGG